MFYARSREYWAQKALGSSENRGKMLRRDGFALADERYVEKILAEAGLDEEEMKRSAAAGPQSNTGQSRNHDIPARRTRSGVHNLLMATAGLSVFRARPMRVPTAVWSCLNILRASSSGFSPS
ncbi:hypothetical protein BDN72DRAFT_525010 [Pluteus cervinus]|uniref:Uncharacterized protein n=1 Tax=Pluteus cervinus TaxID=181527 RepID=A0ACD3AXW8_9AGAR|nr:hypothetical protein BDN72DRAFT_525010 [Pluteus cervinus]